MELGIVLDGSGRLGQPAAVTGIARAADALGYGSVWCVGPWAPTLVGAVAVVTCRVRIGIETTSTEGLDAARAAAGSRLSVVELLPPWSLRTPVRPAGDRRWSHRLDVRPGATAAALVDVQAARSLGVDDLAVRLVDDPDLDEALATYAELGALVEAPAEPGRVAPVQGSPC